MGIELDNLTFAELMQLQLEISQTIKRRFERKMALAFSDVVGSTAYFQRHGDAAGRALLERHYALLGKVVASAEGLIVDTAGDGAFLCFPRAQAAAEAMLELQRLIVSGNANVTEESRLSIRVGLHWGPVLKADRVVTGDSVNLCARVAAGGARRDPTTKATTSCWRCPTSS
ncbi:MAG: adenylate/guanylate cyclase domain-containing protein [Candidatus Riflebacteria bacterium]|nr:adenylate/guanylate cyclase domain-containing protein [Candidatus Riflebacteria bacterium]